MLRTDDGDAGDENDRRARRTDVGQVTRVAPRPRRDGPHGRSIVGIVASIALLAAACGHSASGGTSKASKQGTTNSSKRSPSALAFSRCMRSHGLRGFPDPVTSGVVPKVSVQELGVGASRFQAVLKACQDLLPVGSDDIFPAGEVQELLPGMLRFSQCMRSHGVPDWPDPTRDQEGRPEFPLSSIPGTSRSYWHSVRMAGTMAGCQHLLPRALGGIPAG